jgi:hypothetical protein
MALVYHALRKWYIGKLSERLAASGLTYHDAIAETGVYEQAIGRLPADMQEARQVSGAALAAGCALAPAHPAPHTPSLSTTHSTPLLPAPPQARL